MNCSDDVPHSFVFLPQRETRFFSQREHLARSYVTQVEPDSFCGAKLDVTTEMSVAVTLSVKTGMLPYPQCGIVTYL